MKYTIETTPEEQIALYGMVENLFGTFCTTLVKMEKLRVKSRSTLPVTHEVVGGSDDTSPPKAEAEEGNKVLNFAVRERPLGAEVARGDDRDLAARDEKPLPQKVKLEEKKLARGKRAFDILVRLWAQGFGVEDAEQPDRADAMRNLANGPASFAVLTYVGSVGGLTHAVNEAASAESSDWGTNEAELRRLVLDVAANITQVASILFPDLSELYEYKNIFATPLEDDDNE